MDIIQKAKKEWEEYRQVQHIPTQMSISEIEVANEQIQREEEVVEYVWKWDNIKDSI